MTILEKGKFIKNFVRVDKNGRLVKPKHSNRIGYSAKDVEAIYPQVDEAYWTAWEHYLTDIRKDGKWVDSHSDWQHFLFALNSIGEKDIKKYNLPEEFIIIEEINQ